MRILVVDDEVELARLLALTLEMLGHEAIVSHHPQHALGCLDASVDAVISDLNMPTMNGVELARAMRVVAPELPIAFCTGSDPSDDLSQSASALGTVMPKIFSIAMLRDIVEEFRRRRETPAHVSQSVH